jgi:hypothetical protein
MEYDAEYQVAKAKGLEGRLAEHTGLCVLRRLIGGI